MNKSPYDVLGVSRSASDDEIKKAYRELSRRYHPDANINNPLADLAEEKFKEVQEAYDEIMKERENGGYSYGSGGYSYSRSSYEYGNSGQQNQSSYEPTEIQAVYNFLNNRRFQDAINLLNRMNVRNAQWYYLSAVANAGIGNNILARDYASQAVNMEPNNLEYRQFLNQMSWNAQRYQTNPYGRGYGNTSPCGTGNICCDLWVADSLCECMGGDLC